MFDDTREKSGEDPEFARLVKEIVKHLARSLRNVRSYPAGHPFVIKSTSETHELLIQALEGRKELVMVLFENTLMIEGYKVDKVSVPAVQGLSRDLARTDIRSISFSPAVRPIDLQGLFQVLAMDKLRLQEAGGATEAFRDADVKGVGLNEVEYGIVSRKGGDTGPGFGSGTFDWDSFMQSLSVDGPSVWGSPEMIAELVLSGKAGAGGGVGGGEAGGAGGGVGGGTDGEIAFTNMQKVVSKMLSLYGDDRRKDFTKWFAKFVAGVKPAIEAKLEDKKTFESKMAEMIRNNLQTLSDSEIIDLMMEMAAKKGATESEDVVKEARAFLDALSIQEDRKDDLLEKLQGRLLAGDSGEGTVRIVEEDAIVTSKDSLEKLKQKASGTLGRRDIDLMIEPFMKTLDDSLPDVRKRGAESLGEMLLGLIDKEKFLLAEKSIKILRGKMDKEDSFEVYLAYVSVLEKIARKMREAGRTDIAEKIQATFTEQISSEQKRKRAVQALGKVGGTDALISLLSALWESGIYKEVRDAIVNMGKEAMPLVMEIFREAEDKLLRRRMIDLITNIGADAMPHLVEAARDESWFIRRDVATILSEFEDPRAIEVLEMLSKDKELLTREIALEGIARTKDPEAERILIEALGDPVTKVRDTVIKLLAKVPGEKGALALCDMALQLEDEDLQKTICGSLRQMGHVAAVEGLTKLIEETAFMGRPKYPDAVRVNALFALAKIGGDAARSVVEKAVDDKSRSVQIAAQSALRRMKTDDQAGNG
ncbi:hypothetical protein E3J62_00745 [candidate division TA06 bacterium]|uniref:HEAT repeat domain-containing protein n=1 Tax=candidate division TA06 bacterium TaxID=2250710 RepID=A0A523UYM1_UNCT6|nr:MAG: hypothetical protein E3J62_00745 [candidate division TA06 bacterium]